MRSKIGAALAALLGALAIATPAQATFPGNNGKIAFASGGDIWTVNPDGTGATNLTNSPADHDTDPSWSPDGTKIAFASDHDADRPCSGNPLGPPCNYEIYVMNADGSGRSRITHSFETDTHPRFSPDGTKIAYSGFRGCFTTDYYCYQQVRITDLNGNGTTFDTGLPDYFGFTEYDAGWSPDGSRLAFIHLDNDVLTIYTANPDGSGVQPFRDQVLTEASPDWSPDGTKLLFGAYVGTYPQIEDSLVSENIDRTGLKKLAPGALGVWSPDGTKIAFTIIGAPGSVMVANADGTGATKVADGYGPSWQPLPGPQRTNYKNAAQFCKAELDFLGDAAFTKKYGGGANAYGKCVSAK